MEWKARLLKIGHHNYILIMLVAFLFILPQLITQNMVIGSDAIFHFNRFYDTSQQIKEFNFEYFMSLYGFQQSGRIVNAFYGPFMAYFHGFLVLISKNWFMYQVLSNFVLFALAGSTMYLFLRSGKLSSNKSFVGAIIYMSTFAILYWSTRQGFTSWGAAIFPLCLMIVFDVIMNYEIPKYKLGILTALLFQTHMLTSLFLILIYLPIFLYAFVKSTKKIRFCVELFREIALFGLLTLNISATYLTVGRANRLVEPFVNYKMSSNTINQNSYYWLLNPFFLILVIGFVFWKIIPNWKKQAVKIKLLFGIMSSFLLLSTSLIPWNTLVAKNIKIIALIQFPFRFFVPVSVLVIYLFLYLIKFNKIIRMLPIVSILQVVILMFVSLNVWNQEEGYIHSGAKAIIANQTSDVIKDSFFMKDKGRALELVAKTTPDYLPTYGETSENKYDVYGEKVIQNNHFFKKRAEGLNLVVDIESNEQATIELPVIVYEETQLITGGKVLSKGQFELSSIGTPIIPTNIIKDNQVQVSFTANYLYFFVYTTVFFWLVVVGYYLLKIRKYSVRYHLFQRDKRT